MNETLPYDPFRALPRGSKLLLAFSGGVDSTIATRLCQEAGYRVLAVHLRLLEESAETAAQQSAKVQAAADALGVPLEFLDLQEEFKENVMHYCWNEFASGKTPNPCAICNPSFKFGRLAEYGKLHDCDGMVTGHYAKIIRKENGDFLLSRGDHAEKDQSYFLFGLSREQLAYSYMPLGAMSKAQVRAKANALGLPNANASESQDACFSPASGTLAEKLRTLFHGECVCGNFIDFKTGKVLGRHNGICNYTIGQRKGTGIALGKPAYVKKINAEDASIVICDDNSDLFESELLLRNPNWIAASFAAIPSFHAKVQIRYRGKAADAEIIRQEDGKTLLVRFAVPQRAVTPGQAAVFYDGEHLIGGAWIQ